MTAVPLTERVKRIIGAAPALAQLRPVIEKELIRYDIFYVLQRKALMSAGMAFVGGTCLRLCYGSDRYSEDIDFHAWADFRPEDFDRIRSELERYIYDRYGFETEARSPKELKKDSDFANSRVSTWKVIIKTGGGRKDLPQQRINIDIACLPAYEASPRIIRTNYQDSRQLRHDVRQVLLSFRNTGRQTGGGARAQRNKSLGPVGHDLAAT